MVDFRGTSGVGSSRGASSQPSSREENDLSTDGSSSHSVAPIESSDSHSSGTVLDQLSRERTTFDSLRDDSSGTALDQLSRERTIFDSLRDDSSGVDQLSHNTQYQANESHGPAYRYSTGSDDGTQPSPLAGAEADSTLTPQRQSQIDNWVAENALARDFFDAAGGERVAEALNHKSELGTLNTTETHYLASESLSVWQRDGNTENVREAGQNINNEDTRAIVASVFSQPSVQRFDSASSVGQPPAELSDIDQTALQTAIQLDAPAVITAHSGHEGALGSTLGDQQGYQGRESKERVLNAVSDPSIDAKSDGISQMVTAIFLKSPSTDFISGGYRQSSAQALAEITVDPDQFAGLPQSALQRQISTVAARFDDVLATNGGRALIANDSITPELRGWAVNSIANNPAFNARNLSDGWESPTVSQAFAAPVLEQYQARGTAPEALQGEALRTSIGQALGIPPDQLPDASETPIEQQTRLDAGFSHQYYGPNARIDAIAQSIVNVGGADATVTIMPVVVTSEDFGAATFSVFKVESSNGTHYVEDVDPTRTYDSLSDWQQGSRLPPGKMTYAEGLDWNNGNTSPVTENTAAVTDSFGEWARKVGDGAALVVGVGVGAAIIVGSGGTALLVAGAGAGLYTAGRAGEQLYDANAHGQDITDLSNSQMRTLWLDAAAGTLSFGAMGAASSASKLISSGSRLAPALTNTAAGLQLTASVADLAAGGNQAVTLGMDWQELSTADRALGLLNVAFWGGMTAVSAKAGGGSLADAHSFTRLRNNIEFGSPYPQATNTDLQPGQMRVAYDTGVNGRATNIRIEHGGASNSADIDLHVQAARQIEASGGLRDRLSTLLGSDSPAQIGSAGWEARIEITKIEGEQRLALTALGQPAVSSTERGSLQTRLNELDSAIVEQQGRLDQLETKGEGWVAAPTTGAIQAQSLGWRAAPEGYTWVAGSEQPHIRRTDATGDRQYYHADSNTFSTTPNVRDMERVGHGSNDVEWDVDQNGNTLTVSGTLREFYRYAVRSTDELSAQSIVSKQGLADDQAGHALGFRFILNQGLKNLFPQDANFNTSAYKTLENEMADWVAAGADVHFEIKLSDYDVNGRPETVNVKYVVTNENKLGFAVSRERVFSNSPNQRYDRITNNDIVNITERQGDL